ncbi:MAG TPA: SH3 domain-containing protein [Reyranella sp.]|nr:SH3 domain-containing protein [Reyranella sp.]
MIRAVISTVAVLAGFAVVESSVDASTGQGTGHGGSCKPTEAYAVLQPGETLTVRDQPTPEAPVLGALGSDAKSPVVTVVGSQSGWARIALDNKDYAASSDKPRQYGWVPADHLTVDTRVDGQITVYTRPGLLGREIGRIEGENHKFRMLGCRDELMHVINATEGNVWIDRWCSREEGCRG